MDEIVPYEFEPNESDKLSIKKALDYCQKWCAEHQAEIGVAEMVLGAGIIAWGVHSGQIQMGVKFVASKLSEHSGLTGNLSDAAAAILGGIGTYAKVGIGKAGLVAAGAGISIPAFVLVGGAAAMSALLTHDARNTLLPTPDFGDLCAGADIVVLGTALLIDGASRIIKDERVLKTASKYKDGIIQLVPLKTEVIAKTWDELQALINKLANHPDAKVVASSATTATAAGAGAILSAGSVTVLGSHGLGALAISLGLVSAPIWPVIAAGAGGLALSMAAWKGVEHYRNKQGKDEGN